MIDNCTYLIKIRGQISAGEFNNLSPIQMTVKQVEADATLLSFCSDQSGMVGLMSYLHGMGFIFLSMNRFERTGPAGDGENGTISFQP
jgi:hypothetical protein